MTTVNISRETLDELDDLQHKLKQKTGGKFPKGKIVALGVENLTPEQVIEELRKGE